MPPQPRADARAAERLVARQPLRPTPPARAPREQDATHDRLEDLGFMPLAGGQEDRQDDAAAVAQQMGLGAKAARGAAQRMVRRLLQLRRLMARQLAAHLFSPPRPRPGWRG